MPAKTPKATTETKTPSKTPKTKGKNSPEPETLAAGGESTTDIDDLTPTTLSKADTELLEKVSTLLFQVQPLAARVRPLGYDDAEHEHGRRLHAKASGSNRPLSHWITEGAVSGEANQFTAEQMRLLQEIDAFENVWFPRIRGIIQRAIPADRYEKFVGAFFKDLSQQPLGPTVLDSVSMLLARFVELEKSNVPGAREAYQLGTKRGLTPEKVKETQALIKRARTGMPQAPSKHDVSADEIAKAQAEQMQALHDLRRWYNDWAATFRTVFGVRVLARLGLATIKRGDGEKEEPSVAPGGGSSGGSGG